MYDRAKSRVIFREGHAWQAGVQVGGVEFLLAQRIIQDTKISIIIQLWIYIIIIMQLLRANQNIKYKLPLYRSRASACL